MSEPMSLSEACAVTDQFGRFLRGLDRLQEAAAELRNAEQVVAEKHAESDRLASAIEAAAGELAAITRKISTDKADSAAATREATLAAQKMLEDARAKAADTVSTARSEADAIRQAEADAVARTDAARAQLSALKIEIADTEQKLAAVKEHARKTFGG